MTTAGDPRVTAPLTPDQWRAVKAVVQAALELPREARAAFVAEACEGSDALRGEVESLLDAPDTGVGTAGFLAAPPVAALAAAAADAPDLDPAGDPDGDAAALAEALADRYALGRRLGRGGMATVYLARDLRHGRPVAIKVLHPQLSRALGPERFLREIALTASLQHPHVLPLFDSGSAAGRLYYVMPYVAGETLRARLARGGPLPADEAVRLAREVADALAHAHARGVVHRDVKPENVLLQAGERPHALVADFGVALAVEHAGGARLTRTGLSVGTPQYMAPEQARGERGVDARADVYALGAVLYEMLAGEPPFAARSAQAVVSRLLTEAPPPLEARRPDAPPHVAAAVATALAKRPEARFADAAAFADAIAAPLPAPAPAAAPAVPSAPVPPAPRRGSPVAAVALAALAVGGALGWRVARLTTPAAPGAPAPAAAPAGGAAEPGGAARHEFVAGAGALGTGAPAVTPDGRTVMFRHDGPGGARLYARGVADLVARPLDGTEDGEQPFVSPDGAWVGFAARGAVRRVGLDGGPATVVAALPAGGEFRGGAWGADGTLVFAERRAGALYRVPPGGAAERVPVADARLAPRDPRVLPDGRAALVTVGAPGDERTAVLDLASGAVRELGRGLAPRLAGGQLVFATGDGAVYRQPFDAGRHETTGPAERVAEGVAVADGRAAFDASSAGTLVYRAAPRAPGRPREDELRLGVRDRAGHLLQPLAARGAWTPRVSPDGRTVAYGAHGGGSELWATDLAGGATRQLTADGGDANDPQWSPDGRTVAYSAAADGGKAVRVRPVAGGAARPLAGGDGNWFPTGWTPDGRAVLATVERGGDRDVVVLPADGGPARPYAATPAREGAARVSPDGRWVAYQSDEGGRDEVYVDGYPTPGRRTRVSAAGGVHPVWAPDGRELFYWEGDRLVAARLAGRAAGAAPAVAARTPLFRARYPETLFAMYDVSPDGRRFVVAAGPDDPDRLVVAPGALGARP